MAGTDATSHVADPQRIVVRGVNWLGDAVMTTPALQRLRERFAKSHIELLTHEKLAELFIKLPSIDGITKVAAGESPWAVARRLRRDNFDLALVLPNSPRVALEVLLAGIPERVGYARPWRKWFLTRSIATRPGHVNMSKRSTGAIRQLSQTPEITYHASRIIYPPAAHQIHDYLYLVSTLGGDPTPLPPHIEVTTAEMVTAAHRFGLSIDSQQRHTHPLFGLNPGAEYGPAKRWPMERFISAAAELQRRTKCQWIIFGGQGDLGTAQQIASGLQRSQAEFSHHAAGLVPALNLAGQTSLRELCALSKLCKVVLTNDSGPMHIAAAVGTPVVVPFGSTSPEFTGPGAVNTNSHQILTANVPCAPCFRRTCPIDFRCMMNISVERVVEAVLSVVNLPNAGMEGWK